jgi:hypothetical protein
MSVCPTLLVPHSLARTHNSQTHSHLILSLQPLNSTLNECRNCRRLWLASFAVWHRLWLQSSAATRCRAMPVDAICEPGWCNPCHSKHGWLFLLREDGGGVNTTMCCEILTLEKPGGALDTPQPYHTHTTPHLHTSAAAALRQLRIADTDTLATGSLLSCVHCVRVAPARLQHHQRNAVLTCSHHLIPRTTHHIRPWRAPSLTSMSLTKRTRRYTSAAPV